MFILGLIDLICVKSNKNIHSGRNNGQIKGYLKFHKKKKKKSNKIQMKADYVSKQKIRNQK